VNHSLKRNVWLQVSRVRLVAEVDRVTPVHRVALDSRDHEDQLDLRVTKDLRDNKDSLVRLVILASKDGLDRTASAVILGSLASLETLERLDS